jgi:hypothetical protein
VEILNEPTLAKREFKKLPIPVDEQICIKLLEDFYETLSRLQNVTISQKYRERLTKFVETHNFRYTVTQDCKIQLSIQGILMSLLLRLQKSIENNEPRNECMKELETCIARLSDSQEERNCIRIASNLIEGVAIDKANKGSTTLGAAIESCRDLFPHTSLKDCIKKLYEFCSDYPNLRHAGRVSRRLRNIKKDDALLTAALAISFASYIASHDDGQSVIVGHFE